MSEISLFGDDLPKPRSQGEKQSKPPRVTKKALREKAPEVQCRAPSKEEAQSEDEELARVIRLFAQMDMLAYDDMDKYSDIVEPVISKESRDKLRNWRKSHG